MRKHAVASACPAAFLLPLSPLKKNAIERAAIESREWPLPPRRRGGSGASTAGAGLGTAAQAATGRWRIGNLFPVKLDLHNLANQWALGPVQT
jgi:hypothetical protein